MSEQQQTAGHTTTDEFDPWSTETGLVTDYEGTVVDAWFGTDAKVGGRTTLIAFWKVNTNDPDNPEVEERWSMGPDWASYDGGSSAEHPKGDRKRFNKNSQYGHLIDKAIECGAGEALAATGLTPRSADVWKGTKWYMEAESKDYNFKNDKGEEVKGTSSRNYPSKFLGVGDVTAPATPSATASPAEASTAAPPATATAGSTPSPTPPETPSAAAGDPLSRLDATVASQARLLAKAKTYSEWVDAMMELPGVVQDNDLIMSIADESGLYTTLRAG